MFTIALDRGSNDDRFRLLEMIESKIAIGFFKIGKETPPYAELQLFMKEVDHIFNDKDQNVNAVQLHKSIEKNQNAHLSRPFRNSRLID